MNKKQVLKFIEKANKMNTHTEVLKWTHKEGDTFGYIEITDEKANICLLNNKIKIKEGEQIWSSSSKYRIKEDDDFGYIYWKWEVIPKEQMEREFILNKLEKE